MTVCYKSKVKAASNKGRLVERSVGGVVTIEKLGEANPNRKQTKGINTVNKGKSEWILPKISNCGLSTKRKHKKGGRESGDPRIPIKERDLGSNLLK